MPTKSALIGVFLNRDNQDVVQVVNSQGGLITVLSATGTYGTTPTAQAIMGRYQNPFNMDLIQSIDQSGNIVVVLNAFGASGGIPTTQAIIGRFENPQSLDYIQTVDVSGNVTTILGPQGAFISNLSFTVTDTTIVANWSSQLPSDSNLFASGKPAIDNGVASASITHQAIVTGLSPNTVYLCKVSSGGKASVPQTITTGSPLVRTPVSSISLGSPIISTGFGDTWYNFVSNDNNTYVHGDDSEGIQGAITTYENIRLDKFTNEASLIGVNVNLLSSYGAGASTNGTDGPSGAALTNKAGGILSMAGSLYIFTLRQFYNGTVGVNGYYGSVIKSNDYGATWNNWISPSSFVSTGNPPYPPSPAPYMFGNPNFGFVSPVLYAADDGTLGYNTSGNQIDGANGFVYMMVMDTAHVNNNTLYLARIPRIQLAAQSGTATQFWVGPTSPTPADFVNDSNWQTSFSGITSIYTASGGVSGGGAGMVSRPAMAYIPALNYYVLLTWYRPQGQGVTSNCTWVILGGPTPAGPWTQLGTQNNNPSGWYNPVFMHRTVVQNTKLSQIALTLVYQGDFANQALYYHPTQSSLTLNP